MDARQCIACDETMSRPMIGDVCLDCQKKMKDVKVEKSCIICNKLVENSDKDVCNACNNDMCSREEEFYHPSIQHFEPVHAGQVQHELCSACGLHEATPTGACLLCIYTSLVIEARAKNAPRPDRDNCRYCNCAVSFPLDIQQCEVCRCESLLDDERKRIEQKNLSQGASVQPLHN